MNLPASVLLLPNDISINPNSNGLPGIAQPRSTDEHAGVSVA